MDSPYHGRARQESAPHPGGGEARGKGGVVVALGLPGAVMPTLAVAVGHARGTPDLDALRRCMPVVMMRGLPRAFFLPPISPELHVTSMRVSGRAKQCRCARRPLVAKTGPCHAKQLSKQSPQDQTVLTYQPRMISEARVPIVPGPQPLLPPSPHAFS